MLTKRHAAALAALLACSFATTAHAASPDYSFVDLNYSRIMPDSDSGLEDSNGLEVNGSYALPADFTLVGGAGRATYDIASTPGDDEVSTGYNLGVGYHYPLTDRLDLTAEADYDANHYKFEEGHLGTFSGDNHGTDLSLGVRYMVLDDLELHAYLDLAHTNGTDADSHGYKVGAIYDFASFFGLGVTCSSTNSNNGFITSTTNRWTLFARFQF